jgi:xylulokinase
MWWIAHNSTATQILSCADVVLAALAGGTVLPADTSHHLKSGIDPLSLTWPKSLLEELGISASLLPVLCAPGVIIGTMASGVASKLGLPAGISLVSGMTDGCTSQIATGGIALGDTVGVLGTTLVVKATSHEAVTDTEKGVYSHYSPDRLFMPGGASNIGMASFDALGYPDRESLHHDIERAGSATFASIVHYPLPNTGERFPFHSPTAISLRSGEPHSALDRVRAIMEGIGFAERLGLTIISGASAPPTRHHLSGGGSTSRAWNTLRATILGAPVLLPRLRDSAIGAAIIATAATEKSGLSDIATEVLPTPAVIDPVSSEIEQATERYGAFLDLVRQAGYLETAAEL